MKYKTAMLIDDDEDSNFVDNWIIEKFFAEKVIVMQSAMEALEYLKGNSEEMDKLPEVIFLDLRLPIMDGFGFLMEFNNLPSTVKHKSKIIVLSSSSDKGDFDKAMSNKYVHGYLNKPLSLRAVEEL